MPLVRAFTFLEKHYFLVCADQKGKETKRGNGLVFQVSVSA
jgi:hypothetical protein